jgi:hypothetical protein
MADRGITFSAPMVRALLDGRKTQTRRLLSPQPVWEPELVYGVTFAAGWSVDKLGLGRWRDSDEFRQNLLPLVRHRPGDRLYVREHWKAHIAYDDLAPSEMGCKEAILYLAENSLPERFAGRHRQARHMPRWASRLTLLVTDVRVQRVQDISEEDAIAEGIEARGMGVLWGWIDYLETNPYVTRHYSDPRQSYASLWDSLHTDAGTRWEDNPFIFAASFDVRRENIDNLEGAD